MPQISQITIEEFGRRLRAGATSAAEMTDACLRRIETDDPRLNAYILVTADAARRQAREADRELASGRDRGPLHGVPISIKDLIDVCGTPTTAASRLRLNHVASDDAPVIRNLRRAGAVILGKTNLHEFAFGTTSEDSAFGLVRNPHDTTRSPGGSSGGSAVSVAAGMALASLGTDTGGSIRIPSAACGVVGLKPTYREISTEGVVPLSWSFDHVGPIARTVADASLVYRALMGAAPSSPKPSRGSTAPIRIGVLGGYFFEFLDDDVRARVEEAVERLRSAGAQVDDVEISHASDIVPVYLHISLPESAAYHARALDEHPEMYTVPVRQRLESGRYVLAEDYVRAQNGREWLRAEVDRALAGRDVLALPALTIPAPVIGAAVAPVGTARMPVRNLMLRLTQLFNMTGHPAISIPCGVTSEGLPCGFQLVGSCGQTEALLCTALACEGQIRGG